MNDSHEDLVGRFSAELAALTGHVYRAADDLEAGRLIVDLLRRLGASRALTWDGEAIGMPGALAALREAGIELVAPTLPAEPEARSALLHGIEPMPIGLTGAVAGLADTGSIIVASGPGRARLASLLPPVHIALLPVSRLFPSLPAYLTAEGPGVTGSSNVVIITGPSRTADIEMTLTYGVHGPRELHVVVVGSR